MCCADLNFETGDFIDPNASKILRLVEVVQ
jgi:hypothetical protein